MKAPNEVDAFLSSDREPYQNRVTPFGDLIAVSARGTLMGNRGCLHDEAGQIRRWIICLLSFKDRRRRMMVPGQYTHLFFLDEATALAAGHRPWAECQRGRYELFHTIWARANPDLSPSARPSAEQIDAVLHAERIGPGGEMVTYPAGLSELPGGCFVSLPAGSRRSRLAWCWATACCAGRRRAMMGPCRVQPA